MKFSGSYSSSYYKVVVDLFRELSNKEFNSNDTRGPKSVSAFMVKLSELVPRLVLKQMTLLIRQLDSEVCIVKCSFWEDVNECRPTLFDVLSLKSAEI